MNKVQNLLAGNMGRENSGGKSSTKYISKFCTQTTYAKRLQIKFFLPEDVATS